MFDALKVDYPTMGFYISTDSLIVHSPHFESGLVKLQRGKGALTDEEVIALEDLQV